MTDFIEGESRSQSTLFPESLDDYIAEDSAVRVIDVFIDELDLGELGFKAEPEALGRPAYHPSTLLKLYVYGYLNKVHTTRRLEQEATTSILKMLQVPYRPNQVVALASEDDIAGHPELVQNRPAQNGQTTAYVCQNFTCKQPVSTVEALAALLSE